MSSFRPVTLASAPDSDETFDAFLPKDLRYMSAVHWTPVEVAVRAARWLAPWASTRVLDVGCGVGKLCNVGALQTDAAWYGVDEHHARVQAAIEVARRLAVSERTFFIHGDALSLDWSSYDAFYFYNPFETLLFDGEDPDEGERYRRYAAVISAVQTRLASLRAGTRVVTYHGFGGQMPACYERVRSQNIGLGDLELWIRSV